MKMASTDRLESQALDQGLDVRLVITRHSPELHHSSSGLRLTLEFRLNHKQSKDQNSSLIGLKIIFLKFPNKCFSYNQS